MTLPTLSTVTTRLGARSTRIRDGALLNCFTRLLFHLFLNSKIRIMVCMFSHFRNEIKEKMHFFAHQLATYDLPVSCYLKRGAKLVSRAELTQLPPNTLIHVHVRALGGKGGFGSLLRAIGSQIERTTDQNSKRFI